MRTSIDISAIRFAKTKLINSAIGVEDKVLGLHECEWGIEIQEEFLLHRSERHQCQSFDPLVFVNVRMLHLK